MNLANAAKAAGRVDETRRLYQEAVAEVAKVGDSLLEAINRNNLAVMDLEEGRVDEAEREFLHILRIRREFKDDEGEGEESDDTVIRRLIEEGDTITHAFRCARVEGKLILK
mgnify:CR=1 FL=1